MIILTLNCGSSSVKYQVYDSARREVLAKGLVERVTQTGGSLKHEAKGKPVLILSQDCPDHRVAIRAILDALVHPTHGALKDIREIAAVGHRVVHGGEKFKQSVLIDDKALDTFRSLVDLAPLHLPGNIMGIEAATQTLPGVPQCAVMDTAWHQTMPPENYVYALPYSWYTEYGIRRYGFHGTSFLYTAKRAAVLLGKDPLAVNLIIAHIGNGVSMNAVRNGLSYDTSMGLTPLEGLVMGTRSGDHDPAIGYFIIKHKGVSPDEMENILNKKSGVLGITEKFVDRRDVTQAALAGDQRAKLAVGIETYRLKKYIGAYAAALGGKVDALVFTAGVGEMAPYYREKTCEGLEGLGIVLDKGKNILSRTRNAETEISAAGSPIRILVIPTDEELVITEDTEALISGTYREHTEFRYSFQDKGYLNKDRETAFPAELKDKPGLRDIIVRPA